METVYQTYQEANKKRKEANEAYKANKTETNRLAKYAAYEAFKTALAAYGVADTAATVPAPVVAATPAFTPTPAVAPAASIINANKPEATERVPKKATEPVAVLSRAKRDEQSANTTKGYQVSYGMGSDWKYVEEVERPYPTFDQDFESVSTFRQDSEYKMGA